MNFTYCHYMFFELPLTCDIAVLRKVNQELGQEPEDKTF